MTRRTQLSEQQARYAMENGEFDAETRTADRYVAVVMTQGWCPQWTAMNVWLGFLANRGRPKDHDITVFEFVYDRVDFFGEFLRFKEAHFNNDQIPYIRYYRDGKLIGESNYVTSRGFLKHFEEAEVAG